MTYLLRSGKKTFSCKCLPGFAGRLCDVKVRGCQDYLRANEAAVSGLYEIWLNVPTLSKTVYCYFDHVHCKFKRAETTPKLGQNVDRKIGLFWGQNSTYEAVAPEGRFGSSSIGPF